jgi:parallel beta-helix repeat protein
VYNQQGSLGGWGLNLESTWALTNVDVSENTIHDFDSGGIRVNGKVITNISSNEIVTSSSLTGPPIPHTGIVLISHSTAVGNRIITYPEPLGTSSGGGIEMESDNVVTRNTVEGFTIGIIPLGSVNTIMFNRVSLAEAGIVLAGSSNTVQNNSLFNILHGGAAVQSDCASTSNLVTNNIINGSFWGISSFDEANTVTPNSFSNVTHLISPTC